MLLFEHFINRILIKNVPMFSQKILSSTSVFNTDNRNVSWAPNQHIIIISEGSCDTEEWSATYLTQDL